MKYSGIVKCSPLDEQGYEDEQLISGPLGYESFTCDSVSSSKTGDNTGNTNAINCKNIKPTKASDCVLSKADMDMGYKYCCYNNYGGKECDAYDEEDYQIDLASFQLLKQDDPNIVFDCGNNKGNDNKAGFINISIIFIILVIMNI